MEWRRERMGELERERESEGERERDRERVCVCVLPRGFEKVVS